ncbi:hypothetical protein SCUCBS95973_000795 [Sporothrix curviconia]|uniref:DUF7791 domain-containing protein n=1 Tax=Sporothrix curviconia TaxID=1260050 RepID=A0ABP0ATA7_9PEZI
MDAGYALTRPPDFDVLHFDEHSQLFRTCRRRINAHCGGLLDITTRGIEFIHRTVIDFLKTGPMQDFLASKTPPGFHPSLAALRSVIFLFRCMVQTVATASDDADAADIEEVVSHLHYCLFSIRPALDEDHDATTELLAGFERINLEETLLLTANGRALQMALGGAMRKSLVFKWTGVL